MALRDIAEKIKAMSNAGLLERGTPQGTRIFIRNLLRGDFHPSTIWALHAANFPDRVAFASADRRVTWGEVNDRINRLANGLLALGIEPGDRVAYMLKNSIEWIESLAACGKIGAAAVFVSYRYTPPEVEYLVTNSEAKALLFGKDFEDVIRKARPNLPIPDGNFVTVGGEAKPPFRSYEEIISVSDPSEPAREMRKAGSRVIIYTSGTTGKPKGAVRDLSKAGLGTLVDLLRIIPLRRSDRHLVCSPLYHATGSGFATIHISLGASLYIMEKFDPVEFLQRVQEEKITTTALVPTMLRSILMLPAKEREKHDVSSMRVIVCTGSALPQGLKDECRAYFGEVLYDLYGSTEMGWVTVATPEDQRRKPGSVGKAVPGNDVVLLSEDRKPVPDGQVGELFTKNKITIEGYHANDEATRKARWGDYFSVGDLAIRDEQGYIMLVDRKTDMVISGGTNIYPAEIEDVLIQHPKILEAAVIGIPDDHWGEALLAFIVPSPGQTMTEDEVMDHCRKSLAGYKIPRKIRFLEELPRNPTGKILKKELKAQVAAGA
jgi:fatty-acyl-CoA synthase